MIELLHTRTTTSQAWVATQIRTTRNGNDMNVGAIHRISEYADNYSAPLFAQQVYISHNNNNNKQTGEWFPHANFEKQQFSNVMHHSNLLYLASKALHFLHGKKRRQSPLMLISCCVDRLTMTMLCHFITSVQWRRSACTDTPCHNHCRLFSAQNPAVCTWREWR